MKAIVDDKIPYIREALSMMGVDATYAPGQQIDNTLIRDADALIVRTRTRCDETLLQGSRVQFIATATIGYDHIDTAYCAAKGIRWTNAPGCNATSVRQYVQSVLLLLQKEKGIELNKSTIGIVGVGHVGTLVAHMATAWGMRVLLCDPPRTERGEQGFVSLGAITREADIISLHTPLTYGGGHPTFHLANETFFNSLERKPYFINTSRGEVTDTKALLQALEQGSIAQCIVDVWEDEPHINLTLLNNCYIGTPHIAGYSADGKANATRMSLEALNRHFHLGEVPPIAPPNPTLTIHASTDRKDYLIAIYNPHTDSKALKAHPELFEHLRGNYPLRREEHAYTGL